MSLGLLLVYSALHVGLLLYIGDLHRIVEADARLVFRLRPNSECADYTRLFSRRRIVRYHIDAQGLRGNGAAPPASSLPPIACFGDSHTFGQGLQDEETYPAQLARLLEGYAVLNFGVPAYNAWQSWVSLKDFLAVRRPAAVIFQICANDDEPSVPFTGGARYFHSLPYEFLKILLRLKQTPEFPPLNTARVMRQIIELCRAQGLPLLFMVNHLPPGLDESQLQEWHASGVTILDWNAGLLDPRRDLFRDGHLLPSGSRKVAVAAARLLLRPGFLSSSSAE